MVFQDKGGESNRQVTERVHLVSKSAPSTSSPHQTVVLPHTERHDEEEGKEGRKEGWEEGKKEGVTEETMGYC